MLWEVHSLMGAWENAPTGKLNLEAILANNSMVLAMLTYKECV